MTDLPLSLPEASINARQVDIAFFSVLGITAAIFVILFVLLVVFAARYRSGSPARRGPLPELLQKEIEIGWTVGTVFLAVFIFLWFVGGASPPPRAAPSQLEVHIVAKQWMWKTEHPDGAREIDALHLPVNTPIRLVMMSQDVIHSFYIPAFRLKQDVLPARSTELVFTPTKLGSFHLLCAEFCGTQHSHMGGEIVVVTPPAYASWLRAQPHGDTLIRDGEALFTKFGCAACHGAESKVHAPKLAGLYGNTVTLEGGNKVSVDDVYLRRSILQPRDGVVAGYAAVMPSYAGIATPPEVEALIAYLKSLKAEEMK